MVRYSSSFSPASRLHVYTRLSTFTSTFCSLPTWALADVMTSMHRFLVAPKHRKLLGKRIADVA